jgi:hypothetical protein
MQPPANLNASPPAPGSAPGPAAAPSRDVPVEASLAGRVSRWYLVPCLLIVGASLALLYWGYSQAAIPPGTDPGHWITTSKAFVGLAHPAGDFTLQPLLYPPLTFPFLGVVLLATGSPITTAWVFGGLLMVLYGLTVIHLARRFLAVGPIQVLFVGLAILNGTTLQILFWGGYPNFLALAMLNEALVFLLAFSRTRSSRDALLFYGIVALIYLTHDLTFDVAVGTLVLAGVFLIAQDRRWLRLFISWPNVYGMVLLGGVVAAYSGITDALGIPHPGYLFSNPAIYVLDNLGQLFHPLGYAPLWLPIGPPIAIDSTVMLALLLAISVSLFLLTVLIRRVRRGWVPRRLTIALAALTTTFLLPAGGWILHIDTDYPRFVYYFAVPLALVVCILVELFLRPWLSGAPLAGPVVPLGAVGAPTETSASPTRGWSLARSPSWWVVHGGVILVLVLLLVEVSIPTVNLSEQTYATATQDSDFVQAMQWLKANDTSGAVLADTPDTQRWVQALTDRNALSPGDTWLHFYAAQVLTDEESYFAFNTHYVVSNNQVAMSLSGTSNYSLNETPGYTAFIEGVTLPILRLNPSTFIVTLASGSGTATKTTIERFNAATWLPSPVQFVPSPSPTLTFGFTTPSFRLDETATAGPANEATVTVQITANPQYSVSSVQFNVTQPQPTAMGDWFPTNGITYGGTGFTWNTAAHLGQIPGVYNVATSGTFTQAPDAAQSHLVTFGNAAVGITDIGYHVYFDGPRPSSSSFSVAMQLTTPGTGNPATTFPTYFDTNEFLQQNDIHFLVLEKMDGNNETVGYYENEFGFVPADLNAPWSQGWTILWRP